ncbi:uncharacterized protein ABDE67_013919 isoform 2-T2 [Symphorus nematophorus]
MPTVQTNQRPAPEFLGLTRCAACYNQQAIARRGGDGESSSSAEDSGPEGDCESEAESSSSSSSGRAASEIFEEPEIERPPPVSGDAAEPESGGEDGDGREETSEERRESEESQKDTSRTKAVTRRAPLVKSFSLPAYFTPRLTPVSLLPRPHTVTSTLHLQVLSQEHEDHGFQIVKQYPSEREEESTRGGQQGVNSLLPPQMGLPWQQSLQPSFQQHQLSYQYQQQPHQLSHQHPQQQPQHFPPLSGPGQRLPPPLHTLPVFHPPTLHAPLQALNAPQTHLHALTPQPCWYCYSMQSSYSPYWSRYGGGQLPR